ncbi:tectonic-3-like isoform X2 [Gouania willdenowi]|uniref:Tectonic domain-containing protein n=1 Tax=Gouania willdenowi TaxID=441366 RepID=A0A8C5I582_GOUWI|nr:tectonic-3 isoform X2 [Gouania willdenowi]
MNSFPFLLFIVLYGHFVHSDTDLEPNVTAASNPPDDADPTSSATSPTPGLWTETMEPTEVNTTEETTPFPALNFTENATIYSSEEPTAEAPLVTTAQPVWTQPGCLCDLTADFCDIGCCCDNADCGVANLSQVFVGCPQTPVSAVCVEEWLIFRANVDSSLVTVTDSLFCVQVKDNTAKISLADLQYPTLGNSYHFSPSQPMVTTHHSRNFYKVDDVIQTYFSNSSVQNVLRQPSAGAAALFCMNRNPAKFLRSVSHFCTRTVTPQLCTTDPGLSARSYFADLSLIKIPISDISPGPEVLIPVTPLSDWQAPSKINNSCLNAVKRVEFVIGYSGRGELTHATVQLSLADVKLNQLLMQTHAIKFQLAEPRPTLGEPIPAVGLQPGSPVIGRFDGEVKPVTSLGVSEAGECLSDPSNRSPILFTYNTISGCTFSSSALNCSELQSQIYRMLQGLAAPDAVAMNSGSKPDWTRVLVQDCPVALQETCETGCQLPNALSIQVLWARQGPVDLPQSYILGAKYVFKCRKNKCPLSSPLTLTTKVTFADTTVYPVAPRGFPQPRWKFPFGFFTRGVAEVDGHILDSSDTSRVTWSSVLLMVLMLTGLSFY